MTRWYWFGCIVDGTGTVKLRQYHVGEGLFGYTVESWSKGISGRFWETVDRGDYRTFEEAMDRAREQIDEWAFAYAVIDEGNPGTFEREKAQHSPQGAASADWWAAVLRVNADADKSTVRKAYAARLYQTHPDHGGSNDECATVIAAWEYIQAARGW